MPTIKAMQDLGWGNPNSKMYAALHIKSIKVAGRTFRVRREVAPLFKALVLMLEEAGVDISKGALDEGSYVNRDIRGIPGVKSMHAWGLAIDIDSSKNRLGAQRTTFPVETTADATFDASLTWGFMWRGDRRDPMHFEFNGTRASVKLAKARLRRRRPDIYAKAIR